MCKHEKELELGNELLQSAIKELTFSNLRIAYLCSVLDEIEVLSELKDNGPMIALVVKNARERDNLDKIIHARTLFN